MNALAFLEAARVSPWVMEPKALAALMSVAEKAAGGRPALFGGIFERAIAAKEPELYQVVDGVAHVLVSGTLLQKVPEWLSWFGIDATETGTIKKAVEAAAADDDVDSIMLRVSSPGGEAQGVADVADAIAAVGAQKTVNCVVEGLCASGAYWLASQADSISASKDSLVGSIGVYQVLVDSSQAATNEGYKVHVVRSGEHKGSGTRGAPISDAQLAAAQELVDGFAGLFKAAVADGRELEDEDADAVATGQLWLASTAKKKGLIDTVEPVERALSRLAPDDEDDDEEDSMAKTSGTPNETPKPDAALEQARADERKRVAEIKAAFPGDPAFALEQIEAGSSLVEAKGAYADVLQERLAAEKLAHASTKTAAERPKPAPRAPREAADPVPFAASADASGVPTPGFIELAKAKAKEDGIKLREAMAAIAREQPDVYASYLGGIEPVRGTPEQRMERAIAKRIAQG